MKNINKNKLHTTLMINVQQGIKNYIYIIIYIYLYKYIYIYIYI